MLFRSQSLSLENQLQGAIRSTSPDTNFIANTKVAIAKVQGELTAATDAITVESRRIDALKLYWTARERLDSAEKLFAPYKKKATEIQAFGSSSNKPPAYIVERASKSEVVEMRDASSGNLLFGVAGVLVVIGGGIVLALRPKIVLENKKAA